MKAPISEATILLQKGHLEAARNLLEQYAKAYPDIENPQVDALLYFIFRGLGETDKAIGICSKRLGLTQQAPNISKWHLRRGLLHLRAHDSAQAIEDFSVVIEINCNADQVSQAQKGLYEANLEVN